LETIGLILLLAYQTLRHKTAEEGFVLNAVLGCLGRQLMPPWKLIYGDRILGVPSKLACIFIYAL
jgi:uncharacterized membrane protein YsdA (DUF1294 family)